MPAVIEHIDKIARTKQRDVLYLEFHPHERAARRAYRYADDPVRKMVLRWLDEEQFGWQECGPYANPNAMSPYLGQVYLDVPYDESSSRYCRLRDYLEHADGSMRHEGVRFYAMSLEYANENAEHDEPGFWERWAEGF